MLDDEITSLSKILLFFLNDYFRLSLLADHFVHFRDIFLNKKQTYLMIE